MSHQSTNDDERTPATATATMPPTPPVGADAVGQDAPSRESHAAPAGPGPDGEREAVDSVGATSGSPITKAADAAADAARQAAGKLKDAAENADLDQLAENAKRVTGEWTERVKQEYRARPGVVIGAAVVGVVVLGAIVRAIGRR